MRQSANKFAARGACTGWDEDRMESSNVIKAGGWRLKAAPGGCAAKPACAGRDEDRMEWSHVIIALILNRTGR